MGSFMEEAKQIREENETQQAQVQERVQHAAQEDDDDDDIVDVSRGTWSK